MTWVQHQHALCNVLVLSVVAHIGSSFQTVFIFCSLAFSLDRICHCCSEYTRLTKQEGWARCCLCWETSHDHHRSFIIHSCHTWPFQSPLHTCLESTLWSHIRTVLRACCKGDKASQCKRPKFNSLPHQNSLTNLHKNWHAWLRPGRHPVCKIL